MEQRRAKGKREAKGGRREDKAMVKVKVKQSHYRP
jgi:hypothetical protein